MFSWVVNDLLPTSVVTKGRLVKPSSLLFVPSEHDDKQNLFIVIEGLRRAKYLD